MEATIYNLKGEGAGKITLPESIFSVPWNSDMVHQVVVSMTGNARRGTAHTKTRGEVRGGGKKPWRQKGTGQARHGSTRSPIWVGGGISHGPRSDKNYERKINIKTKNKALFAILSKKMKDGEVAFVENFNFTEPKTSRAKETLTNWKKIPGMENIVERRNNALLIATSKLDSNTKKSFRNLGNVYFDEIRNLNPLVLLQYRGLVVVDPENSIAFLSSKKGVKAGAVVKAEKATPAKKKASTKKKA